MYVWPSHLADWASTGYSGNVNLPRGQLNGKMKNPRSHSHLRIWSRETGSTVPSDVSPHILYTWTEYGMLLLLLLLLLSLH